MQLIDCRKVDNKLIQSFKDEFEGGGIPGAASLDQYENLDEWKSHLDANENLSLEILSPVRSTTYFIINNNYPIGVVDIRHQLNDKLLKFGGHIGYSVRVSERNKGYGKKLLKEALKICRGLNIDKVLITCNDRNTSSIKVIESNFGIL